MGLNYERTVLSFKVDASANNIPTTFGTGAGSLLISTIASARHITIVNETAGRLAVNMTKSDPVNAPTLVDFYVPAAPSGGFTSMSLDDIEFGCTIYVKSDTGSAITTGLVYGFVS